MYTRTYTTVKLCLAISLFLLSVTGTQAFAASYAVIGNAKNMVPESNVRYQIKRLYLKQQKRWSNGVTATVFDRGSESSEDKAFRDSALNMSLEELSDHWLSVKQRTGETPPRTITSTRTLFKLISRYEGSFGVVSESYVDTLPDGIRVLLMFND